MFVHPNFDRTSYNNDVCLLRMQTEVLYVENLIQPACFPETLVAPGENSDCYVAGWGDTEPNEIRRKQRRHLR